MRRVCVWRGGPGWMRHTSPASESATHTDPAPTATASTDGVERWIRCSMWTVAGSIRAIPKPPTLAHNDPSPTARSMTSPPARSVPVTRPEAGSIFRRRSNGPDTQTEPCAYATVGGPPALGPTPGSSVCLRGASVDGSSAAMPVLLPAGSRTTYATQRRPPPSANAVGVAPGAFASGLPPCASTREIVWASASSVHAVEPSETTAIGVAPTGNCPSSRPLAASSSAAESPATPTDSPPPPRTTTNAATAVAAAASTAPTRTRRPRFVRSHLVGAVVWAGGKSRSNRSR